MPLSLRGPKSRDSGIPLYHIVLLLREMWPPPEADAPVAQKKVPSKSKRCRLLYHLMRACPVITLPVVNEQPLCIGTPTAPAIDFDLLAHKRFTTHKSKSDNWTFHTVSEARGNSAEVIPPRRDITTEA